MVDRSQTSEQQAPQRATREEWSEAWKTFNSGVKQLRELAIRDGITIKLSVPMLGKAATKKKAR